MVKFRRRSFELLHILVRSHSYVSETVLVSGKAVVVMMMIDDYGGGDDDDVMIKDYLVSEQID